MQHKKRKIFITGGAGVIGSEIVKLLSEDNLLICDKKPKPSYFNNKINYIQSDLNVLNPEIIYDFNPEIIIHLAASFERSEETFEFWNENYLDNLILSHRIISIAKKIKSLKKYIFASSYLIYDPINYNFIKPKNNPVKLDENNSILPRNLTGISKFYHENELKFLRNFKSIKFKSISVRIFRGYGKNSRDIISRWIRQLLENKKINIYNKEGIFDFIYSKDTAKGITKIVNSTNYPEIVNLGTGKSHSIKQVIDVLKKFFPKMQIKYLKKQIKYESSEANMDLFSKTFKLKKTYSLNRAIKEIISYEKSKIKIKEPHKTKLNILVTSSANKTSLIEEVIHAAKKINKDSTVFSGDSSSNVITKFITKKFWKMPLLNNKNLNKIIMGCNKRKINIIIPSSDQDLIFFSLNNDRFIKNKIKIIISSNKAINICSDKLKFYNFGDKNKLNFIYTSNVIDFNSKKYVVKERFGSGSKNINLNLNKKEALIISKRLDHPIFQPYLKGKEISVDTWISKNNEIKGLIMRERLLVLNGESQVTKIFKNKIIEKKFTNIIKKLKLKGPINMQAIINKKGLHILECNPRFGGASNFSIKLGLDVFYWSFLEFLNLNLKDYKFIKKNNISKKIKINKNFYL